MQQHAIPISLSLQINNSNELTMPTTHESCRGTIRYALRLLYSCRHVDDGHAIQIRERSVHNFHVPTQHAHHLPHGGAGEGIIIEACEGDFNCDCEFSRMKIAAEFNVRDGARVVLSIEDFGL